MNTGTGYRVGVDVGGTFTDIICVKPDGEIVLDKTPTTLEDQSIGVMNGLGQLAQRLDLSLTDLCGRLEILVHGIDIDRAAARPPGERAAIREREVRLAARRAAEAAAAAGTGGGGPGSPPG